MGSDARRSQRAKEYREAVAAYKMERGCERCGYNESPLALDLDHIDPASKVSEISRMISNNLSWYSILAELEKCRVLCANCHRVKTHGNEESRRPVTDDGFS